MGSYEIEIHGTKIRTNVVHNLELINLYIDQLRSTRHLSKNPIVGIDLRLDHSPGQVSLGQLVLHRGTQCLVIQFKDMQKVPESVKNFLDDPDICFVCINKSFTYFHVLSPNLFGSDYKVGVELGEFAARVLKNNGLVYREFHDIAKEIGIGDFELPGKGVWCGATCFTDEEVKVVASNAFAGYVAGTKVLTLLK